MERTIAGDFRARHLGSGAWQLTTGVPAAAEIYLGGAEPDAADRLGSVGVSAVALAWQGGGVSVTLISPQGPRRLESRTAIIHEPLPRLYEGLPLMSLDQRARRFWRRVFRLVRIPGGRLLLGLIARRAGGPK
jgi:hypothetical protein